MFFAIPTWPLSVSTSFPGSSPTRSPCVCVEGWGSGVRVGWDPGKEFVSVHASPYNYKVMHEQKYISILTRSAITKTHFSNS